MHYVGYCNNFKGWLDGMLFKYVYCSLVPCQMPNLFILPKPALVVKVLTNRRANIMFSAFFHIWDFLAVFWQFYVVIPVVVT